MKVGDIVMVPCRVIGTSSMAYSEEKVVDLQPLEFTSGQPYCSSVIRPFTVYARDVKQALEMYGER
jgi:hypothetical protein